MLKDVDNEVFDLIEEEKLRQHDHLELIASENYVSKAILECNGSILTNKYAEGYPNKRYYGGCEYVDGIETLAIERVKKLFNVKYANVQPHSGSQANMASYRALLNLGDTILGMGLNFGGHLTHGYSLSFSGQDYKTYEYTLNKDELLDYDEILNLALKYKPKLIVAGASAYSRIIDFKKFREIADKVNAYLMVDMAHIAGLVAAGLHPNPCEYADIVTSTTHKTLRGPRGGIILTNNEEIINKVNKAIFPGIQGGPLMHIISGKAVCFKEALQKDFIDYQKQVVKNAKVMANTFNELGYRIISKTTDNHLLIIDVNSTLNITGKEAENVLGKVNITVNKNSIPFDTLKPFYTSGIRLGSPALTTRGFKEEDFKRIVYLIDKALRNKDNLDILKEVKKEVLNLIQEVESR